MRKKSKRFLSVLLAMLMIFTMSMPVFGQANDYKDHWASKEIDKWIAQEVFTGDPDGSFRPEDPITRAEFAAVIARTMGYTDKVKLSYSDVAETDWYADVVSKVTAAGIFQGSDGKFRPKDNISRQEVAIVLARAFDLFARNDKAIEKFKDINEVAAWSREALNAVIDGNYMSGRPGGILAPKDNITRAECVKLIDNIAGQLKNKAGTYTGDVEGNLVVNTPDVILKDMRISGDLFITQGVGDGDVTLDNVVVEGRAVVRGGGVNSIIIKNSNIGGTLLVLKTDGNIRIVVADSSYVEEAVFKSGAILEADPTTSGFKEVKVLEVPAGEQIQLEGDFGDLIVDSADVVVEILDGKVENLTVTEEAKDTKIRLGEKATVTNLTANAPATVEGQGSISNAEIKADGVKLETKPEKIDIVPGVTAIIADEEVSVPETEEKPEPPVVDSGGGGGGGGGYSPGTPEKKVEAVSVKPEAITLAVGATIELEVEVTTTGGASKDVTWSSSDEAVVTVDDNGKVTAIGEGTATVTATSDADSRKKDSCTVTVVKKAIILEPSEGSSTVLQGEVFEENTVTLSSNYNSEGLKTFISLARDGKEIHFDKVFEKFSLTTTIGDKEDGPYDMTGAYSRFQYGPPNGFPIEAGVAQVTTSTGKVKADAPVGTDVITTEVKSGDTVLASATYTLSISPKS
jgi:hypothetical protein